MSTFTPCSPKPFLWHVAKDLLERYGKDMSHLTVVFPNKRAQLFLNEHFANLSQGPIWSPAYTTISDLFRMHSHLTSMADTRGIFTNLCDLHSFDSVDYLSDQQIQVLKHFFKGFDEHHNSKLREKFLRLWSQFGKIYDTYRQILAQQDLAYEGFLFRTVVENERIEFGTSTYVFVGFNALQEVERRLFKRLKGEGKAEFYWDFDSYYMGGIENENEAGAQIRKFMMEFPNQLDNDNSEIYDHLRGEKEIVFIGAPTDSMQARYVGSWLQSPSRIEAGNRTAVVLCNEGLLPTVIHSIPSGVEEVNITTGYPLIQTAAASFITQLMELAFFGRAGGKKYRQKYVLAVLHHPFASYLTSRTAELCDQLLSGHRYYPSRDELSLDEGLKLLFRDLEISDSDAGKLYDRNNVVNRWLLEILRNVAIEAQHVTREDPLTHESLFRAYTLINRLQSLIEKGDLRVDPTTYQRLIRQVMASASVPFHGEPAVGLQVMGVLETRNLDFDHLLILSCNEGNMPKGLDTPSFIPHSIRKAFGLTTIDHKVAVYSYYFHRLLQRADDITITFNNSTEDGHTGEMSRFVMQLMVESPHHFIRQSLQTGQTPFTAKPSRTVEKDEATMKKLHEFLTSSNPRPLYPTSINRYLRCPLLFYYNDLMGFREPDAEEDVIDNRTFGNIFHRASEIIYQEISINGRPIVAADLQRVLKTKGIVERAVDQAFREEMFNHAEQMPDLSGLQIINREVIIRYIRRLLDIDAKLAPFTILGTEKKVFGQTTITTSEGTFDILLSGYIDRLDQIGNDRIRVVDYKTGSRALTHKVSDIEQLFARPMLRDLHPDYYLQTMLYAHIVRNSGQYNPKGLPVSPALLFIQHATGDNYDPTLVIDRQPIGDINAHENTFMPLLNQVISEIFEPQTPFRPTADRDVCTTCPFSMMCQL